ncbi:hypothetical protein WNZ15_20055 [Roseibium sp. AS2]|uniref:hypothetical protein n=1 Tax=Roseibium sp. AS2 TaxID=3135781 RepID=UPI0031739E72
MTSTGEWHPDAIQLIFTLNADGWPGIYLRQDAMFIRKSTADNYSFDLPLELEDGPPAAAYRRVSQVLSLSDAVFLGWAAI